MLSPHMDREEMQGPAIETARMHAARSVSHPAGTEVRFVGMRDVNKSLHHRKIQIRKPFPIDINDPYSNIRALKKKSGFLQGPFRWDAF